MFISKLIKINFKLWVFRQIKDTFDLFHALYKSVTLPLFCGTEEETEKNEKYMESDWEN